MEYIQRELERKFMEMNASFKAIMVTGARQVGKTTMLKKLAQYEDRTYVSMDDARSRELAKRDVKLFFQMYRPPLLIDEVQKAPELFEEIKLICDNSEQTGLFWLTGSESKKLLKEAGDSLAGRICILKMYSLSQREKLGQAEIGAIDFTFESLKKREDKFAKNNINDVFQHIWDGGMPGTIGKTPEQREEYFESYINTYLMRDAVDDNGITDTVGFRSALNACAAFIGNILNYSDIAAAGNVSPTTAKTWVKILQNMGIIYLLAPYSNNELNRLIKTPKLYFCDTGLAAYLSMWPSKDVLMNGAASGHYFENYVIGELLRGYQYAPKRVNMTYYRDTNQKEVDVVIDDGAQLHPMEIKRAANLGTKAVKSFRVLEASGRKIGLGGVICMTDVVFPIDTGNVLIPCNII